MIVVSRFKVFFENTLSIGEGLNGQFLITHSELLCTTCSGPQVKPSTNCSRSAAAGGQTLVIVYLGGRDPSCCGVSREGWTRVVPFNPAII